VGEEGGLKDSPLGILGKLTHKNLSFMLLSTVTRAKAKIKIHCSQMLIGGETQV
jgi:hypothetical protein